MNPQDQSGVGGDGRVTTPRVAAARESITQVPVGSRPDSTLRRVTDRILGVHRGDRAPALPPYPGTRMLRFAVAVLLAVLCFLTIGGAVLLLLLWQQGRDTGILTSQIERTADLLDVLQTIERWVASAIVPVAMAWIVLATVNAGRATGNRRNPFAAAISLPVGLFGIWLIGDQVVAPADDRITELVGLAIQIAMLAIPMLFLERVATAAEARHRPLRAGFLISAVYLAQLQFLGGLSTIDLAEADGKWGQYGAYLLIGGLIQILGSLALNEGARAIEDSTDHRYQLRARFSESLLAQAARR